MHAGEWISRQYFPERKIVMISVEFEYKHGYAVEPTKFFAGEKIRLLSCIIQNHPDRESGHATLFLDITGTELTPEEIANGLASLSHIKRIEIIDLPLTHGEARLTVFTLGDVHYLLGMLRELGDGGLAMMYHMGYKAGKLLAEKVSPYYKDNERALDYLLLYYQSLGHGIFEIEKYIDGVYCEILARELFECLGVKSNRPNSQIFRGLLAGFISVLWKREVKVIEVKCLAKGDTYCEFKVE